MNILYFYSDNSTKLDSMPRAVAAESGLVAIACINHVSIYIYILVQSYGTAGSMIPCIHMLIQSIFVTYF